MSRATTVIAYINIPFKPEWEEETAKILGRAIFPDVNVYSELDKPFVQLTGKRSSLARLLQYLHSADSAKITPYSRAEPKARVIYNPARQLSSRGEKLDMLLLDIEANSVGAGKSYHGNVLKDTKRISRTLLGQSAKHDVCVDVF